MAESEIRYMIPLGATLTRDDCRRCKAALLWLPTKTGRRIPLDVASARIERDGRRSYLAHFATCPELRSIREERTKLSRRGQATMLDAFASAQERK